MVVVEDKIKYMDVNKSFSEILKYTHFKNAHCYDFVAALRVKLKSIKIKKCFSVHK